MRRLPDEFDFLDHVLRPVRFLPALSLLSRKGLRRRQRAQIHHHQKSQWTQKSFPAGGLGQGRSIPPKIVCSPAGLLPPGLRVGFLVGHWGCFNHGPERQTFGSEINLQSRRSLQSALNQSFRQWVFDVLL